MVEEEHYAIFVLVPIEKAKTSFEARKLVALQILYLEEMGSPPYPRVGGDFTGLLSNLCDKKSISPFYNEELRASVRKYIQGLTQFLNFQIEQSKQKRVATLPSYIKDAFSELRKYNDDELFTALKIELAPLGIDIDLGWTRGNDILYTFTKLYSPYTITPELLENGRDVSLKLGYDDDAMIVNDCLYQEVIEEMLGQGKVINIEDIGEGEPIMLLLPEEVIGKKWIVLVDYNKYFIGCEEEDGEDEDTIVIRRIEG